MGRSKKITYIDSLDWSEFCRYRDSHPNLDCVFIVDESFLSGKQPGEIIHIDRYKDRWNYVGIQESIDRFMENYKDYFEKEASDIELEHLNMTEEDLKMGIGD